MIKKGTRYLLLPLLFVSMCVCAGVFSLKPVKIVGAHLPKPAITFKTIKKYKKANRAFAGSITVFTVPGELSDAVFTETTPNNYVIGIPVHAGTDISNITPHVEISPGATISPFPTDVPTDFNSSKLYTVDPAGPVTVHYNVQVLAASAASVCAGAPITLMGTGTPPGTFKWQQLQPDNTWADAPGADENTDYYIAGIPNTSGAPKVFTFRRAITFGGTTYDSYCDLTVNPVIPITGNTIHQPSAENSTFCVSGDPGTIQGDPAAGGDGNPQYQWQSSAGGNPFADISGAGAKGKDYAPGTLTTTTKFQRVVKSGDCNVPTNSNTVTITIQNAIAGNSLFQPGTTTFCGTSGPLSLQGSNPPTGGDNVNYSYQWQSCTDGVSYADIPGSAAKLHDYNGPAVTQTTYFRRMVSSGACSPPVPSDNVITITIQPPLSANTIGITGSNTFCGPGDPGQVTGSPVTGGDGTPVYKWESSPDGNTWQPISGVVSESYSPGMISSTTYFHRIVTSGECSTPSISTPVKITIQSPLSANMIGTTEPNTFCASGDPGQITGSAVTGGDGTPIYKWESSPDGNTWQPISGVVSESYSPGTINTTTYFHRIATSGSCSTPSISTPVVITVQQPLSGNILTPPPVTAFCASGSPGPITGRQPTGGDGSPSYQWQQAPDNVDAHFINITGQNDKDLTPPTLTSTMFYRRVITEQTCTTPVTSNVIEIHVTQPLDPTKNHITPPLTTTFCTSYDPNTIIGNFGADNPPAGVDAIVYQWLKSTDNGASWVPITENGNSPDYDPDPITVTTWYMRTVRSGACATPINSVETVKLNIIDSPPNIAINPAAPICAGETATLSIASPDAALTYNWYDTPTKDNLLSQGVTFKTTTLTANQTFYAEASNGTCSSPQLASVVVTVIPLPGVPVLSDAAPTGCEGSPAILKIASPQNDLTYKWYSAATGGSPLFTGPEFTTPGLTGNVTYYAEAGNSSGCVSSSRAAAVITVYPLPVAIAQGATICPGTIATLTSNSPDPDQTINWYDVPTGGTPVGTGSSFTTPLLNSAKSYYAEAVNTISGCVSATRAEAKVQISTPLNSPVVHVTASVAPDVTFAWAPVDGAVAYRVSTDNGASYTDPSTGPDGTSHTVTGLQIGQRVTIIVRAIGNASCETSADSNPVTGVTTDPDVDKIFVANAFTPNGDGKNDIVYAHNDNIKSIKFYVYDQWGNMLFQSLSLQKGWDGTYKGKLQPVGVYVYYLEAVMNDGQPVTKKGTITLLR